MKVCAFGSVECFESSLVGSKIFKVHPTESWQTSNWPLWSDSDVLVFQNLWVWYFMSISCVFGRDRFGFSGVVGWILSRSGYIMVTWSKVPYRSWLWSLVLPFLPGESNRALMLTLPVTRLQSAAVAVKGSQENEMRLTQVPSWIKLNVFETWRLVATQVRAVRAKNTSWFRKNTSVNFLKPHHSGYLREYFAKHSQERRWENQMRARRCNRNSVWWEEKANIMSSDWAVTETFNSRSSLLSLRNYVFPFVVHPLVLVCFLFALVLCLFLFVFILWNIRSNRPGLIMTWRSGSVFGCLRRKICAVSHCVDWTTILYSLWARTERA